ncbi:DUF4097 family beta strand repeat-containing protein [Nocardioides panaciterrulae]|uniref:DUF4097 and DUF4098 domain-containing protein YvlB n=1 Tax=Nocardioides panaciterrulae TaxID=661492 RepID=A0A7Y9J983_9ACTN|nr:DUF4097 family beta strand repeat-containing protein [Nocardioides panaciterrulae]NYD40270.1 DUF4097 and DUF4098 domain-containing protein YvlB [Nocardioides panaciterrulae]
MSEHRFESPRPVELYVELGRGSVTVHATDTAETHVEVTGRDADEVHVTQDGAQVSVVAPKQRGGLFGSDSRLDVVVTLPTDSDLAVKTGSADVTVDGQAAACQVRTGSGDVGLELLTGAGTVTTGSGGIRIREARGELRLKSGSGDVTLGEALAGAAVSTGSGDVEMGRVAGPVVVKTGSGDLTVAAASDDLSFMTGSGDLQVRRTHRGRVTVKGASSDVQLGIPAGVPVWTDISTVSGEIRSDLTGAGQPQEGTDHVEVRAKTVSGDIVLTEV